MPASLRHLTEGEKALCGYNPAGMLVATVRKMGNGHAETTIRTVPTIQELPPNWGEPPQRLNPDTGQLEPAPPEEPRAHRLASSIRRAKRLLRHRIKVAGYNTMLTLTWSRNMQDRAEALRAFKEMCRRLRRYWPTFRCVGVLERQKRGAYHWHLACNAPPPRFFWKGGMVRSFDLVRRTWEGVIRQPGRIRFGGKGGKVFAGPLGWNKLIGYLCKYLSKSMGDFHQMGTRAYHWSGDPPPVAHVIRRHFAPGAVLDALLWVESEAPGVVVSHFATHDGDEFTIWDARYAPPS
jgi:hypothetical protein